MFTQTNYSDAYDREKLRILQALNTQVQSMVVKLDQIVTQAEENIFKIKPSSQSSSNALTATRSTLVNLNGSFEKQPTATQNTPSKSGKNLNKKSKSIASLSKSDSDKNLAQTETTVIKQEPSSNQTNENKPKQSAQVHNKRNKQQRIFNTFVRDSINQLLGPEFMKTHDVQDIDAQVMEMIRKEAVENYLPDNIRPRRAWHLAKASLRTLKRTLNNRKT